MTHGCKNVYLLDYYVCKSSTNGDVAGLAVLGE